MIDLDHWMVVSEGGPALAELSTASRAVMDDLLGTFHVMKAVSPI